MFLLTSTSDLIQVITGGTQAIKVHASYVDVTGTPPVATAGRLNTAISSATTTSVVASPAASTQRNVKFLSIYNSDASTADTITVQHTDGTTVTTLFKLSLLAGYTINFVDGAGWQLFNAVGALVQTASASGTLLKVSTVLNGTTTFTTGTQTNSIKAYLQAAGGAGGGAAAVTGEHGSGGSAGGYAEWVVAVSPNTAYTCAVAASATGVSGATGNAGGNTTLTIGGTTCTANGGPGGLGGNSATVNRIGPAPAAVSTNGTVNQGGPAGLPAIVGANGISGAGANSQCGCGAQGIQAQGVGSSAAALGFGGGGGGAFTTGTIETGGASGPGVLIIEEYS